MGTSQAARRPAAIRTTEEIRFLVGFRLKVGVICPEKLSKTRVLVNGNSTAHPVAHFGVEFAADR